MHGIRIVFIFAFAKELISYPFSPFIILIINIPKMEKLRGGQTSTSKLVSGLYFLNLIRSDGTRLSRALNVVR